MNLRRFRLVREAMRQKFNLTEVVKAFHTSRPGVSKAIIELEEELDVGTFTRHGKRIRGLTEPGRRILAPVERALEEVETLKRVDKDHAMQDQGNSTITIAHAQARYALPEAITKFAHRYPRVRPSIQQGTPAQITGMVLHNQADPIIVTEGMSYVKDSISILDYQW